MKQEIKFRAWDKVRKIIVNVVMLSFEQDVLGFDDSDAIEYGNTRDFELMQYTGLDDVNGKPIYECDIVRAHRTCRSDSITFANGSFGIAPDYWHSFESFTDFYGKCEVIGNRFENPELLEVEE